MNTLDRTFVGATGALLMAALVVRTVAQQPQTPSVAAPNQSLRPQASLIVNADEPAEASPAVADDGSKPKAVEAADKTQAKNESTPAKEQSTQEQSTAKVAASKGNGKSSVVASAGNKVGSPTKVAASNKPAGAKPDAGATASKPLVEQDGDVRMEAKGAIYDEGHDVARLTQDVRLWQDGQDFVLTCQNLVYDRGLNRAVATGDVKIEGRDTTITGDKLEGDFYKKVVVLTGNVDMRSRGKGDGTKSDDAPVSRSKPSRMTCDRVEYNYESRDAIVTGNIKMMQEDSTGTCDQILFNEEKNIVTLVGHAVFENTKGQTLEGPTVKIWLDSGMAQVGKVKIRSKQNQAPAPRPTKADDPPPVIPEDILNQVRATPTPATKPAPSVVGTPAPVAPPLSAPPVDNG